MDREKNLAAFNPILDENGKPKVFYHGTNKEDFSQFKLPGRKGTGGNAIFVSEDPQTAAYFTHKAPRSRIYPVYVSANNLFDHTNPEHFGKLEQFIRKNFDKLFPGALFGVDSHVNLAAKGDYGILEDHDVVNWMKKQGHDGFYVKEGIGRPQNIALFNPSNIKSAISNTGEYDKTNPDITKAEGGAVDINHPEFRRWFGKSVTHQEGQPVKFYHGTSKDKDFNKFKMTRHGVWLTTDPEEASMYAKQNDSQNIVWDGLYKTRYTNTASRVIPVYAKIENPYTGEKPEHVLNKDNYKKAQSDWFDSLRMKGYDGWIPSSSKGSLVVALGHSGQIKSALTNTGEYDDDLPMHRAEGGAVDLSQYQDKTGFGLYSHAAETAAALPQAKGTPDQMKSMLMKQGVKPAEIEHSNYDDVFGQRPSVTKDELVQHFRQSMPTIKEHVLKRPPDLYAMAKKIAEENGENWHEMPRSNRDHYYQMVEQHATTQYNEPSKFDDYSMPGGENYREVLLQLERNEDNYERQAGDVYRKKSDLLAAYDKLPIGDPRRPAVWQQIAVLQQEYNQLLDKANETQQVSFKSGHWDQPDVLAHLRMKDRTGPNGEKILHVDEIQSDWGQQGRGGNFQNPRANEEFEQYVKDLREKLYQQNVKTLVDNKVREENKPPILAAMKQSIEEMDPIEVARSLGRETVAGFDDKREKLFRNARLPPHGPYVTNTAAWTDLALKRALHEAAAGGYDKVVFTKGDDQAERYDLKKHIGSIEAYPTSKGMIELKATDPYGEYFVHDDVHEPKELPNIVGKEIADKIMQKIAFPKDREGFVVRNKKSGHISETTNTLEYAQQALALMPASLQPDLEIVPRKWREAGRAVHLDNLDLEVGGEGMRHFYDKLVPKQLMEITKRHDPEVKMKPDVIDTPEGPKDVHAIDITPKLRESVLRGQKAFAEGGAVDDDGITAYHGSPHDFDKFDISKIGTGEGAQAYGHGLYFAEAEPVAKGYRDRLSQGTYKTDEGKIFDPYDLEHINVKTAAYKNIDSALSRAHDLLDRQPENADMLRRDIARLEEAKQKQAHPHKGHMYEVSINAHPDHFLDWDKPLDQQSDYIKQAMTDRAGLFEPGTKYNGERLYRIFEDMHGDDDIKASQELAKLGIKGIKYLDSGARDVGKGTRNYVVFDHDLVTTKRKYARGGSVAA